MGCARLFFSSEFSYNLKMSATLPDGPEYVDSSGLCFGLADEDCAFGPNTPQKIVLKECTRRAGSTQIALACMLTCCSQLQCLWVEQRPATRCNLLLHDGRTAGELCWKATERTPLDVCNLHAAPITRRPLDLPVFWITLNDTSTRSRILRAQLGRTAVQYTRISAVNRVQARDAVMLGQTRIMATGVTDAEGILPPAPPMSRAARTDFDARVSLSVIACALSHLKAIYTAYLAGHESAVILEDDVSLRSAFSWPGSLSNMTSAAQTPRGGWDILQLASMSSEYLRKTRELEQPFWPARPWEAWRPWNLDADVSSAAYVISRTAMAKILNYTQTSAVGTRRLAMPIHADKLLFVCCSERVYTRNWPLVFFQQAKSQILHLPGINDAIQNFVLSINAAVSRQLDAAERNHSDPDNFLCHHHMDVNLPCVSSHTCPIRGLITLKGCKRRCCATVGCGVVTHNKYLQCYLRRAPMSTHASVNHLFLADSVRHRTVSCHRSGMSDFGGRCKKYH